MEFFAAGVYEIKLDIKYKDNWGGGEKHVEHYLTSAGEMFDQTDLDIVWEMLRKRLQRVDKRLMELGVMLESSEATEPRKA